MLHGENYRFKVSTILLRYLTTQYKLFSADDICISYSFSLFAFKSLYDCAYIHFKMCVFSLLRSDVYISFICIK